MRDSLGGRQYGLGVSLAGVVAWFAVTLVLLAGDIAIELASRSLGVPINIRPVWIFLLGNLLAGIILGRAAPVRGMLASVTLASASVPVLALASTSMGYPRAGLADFRLTASALSEGLLRPGSALSRRRAVHSLNVRTLSGGTRRDEP